MQKKVLSYAFAYFKLILGSAMYAAGFSFFLYPNSIMVGGISGIAMIINYLSDLPVGVMTIVLNIPLFALAWKKLGIRFILGSLAGMLLSSVLMDAFNLTSVNITSDPLLACIYGGIIKGFGLGLIYSAGGTTGGIDIAAKLLRQKRPDINIGTFLLFLDVVVILAFALIFSLYESALYAAISMFIASKTVDLTLYGANQSKVCYIITSASHEIATEINSRLRRGATFLHGERVYSKTETDVILCVIKPQQIVELRQIIRNIDENAFIIISDSKEVLGKGFGNIMSND